MTGLAVAVDAVKGCFRNWRLWTIQFVANPLLFALFAAWLLIPVANAWHLVLNALVALFLLLSVLVLHAGTLNYFYSHTQSESPSLRETFVHVLRNLFAVLVCATVLYLLWYWVGKLDDYTETVPPYLRSISPLFVRKHAALPFFEDAFEAILFTLRWILLPGLILPLLAGASHLGIHAFGRRGFTSWEKSVASFSYWGILIVAALVGVLATEKIMAWTPDFRTSTLRGETTSVVLRTLVSYLLALCAWMLACSVVGNRGGFRETADDSARHTAA